MDKDDLPINESQPSAAGSEPTEADNPSAAVEGSIEPSSTTIDHDGVNPTADVPPPLMKDHPATEPPPRPNNVSGQATAPTGPRRLTRSRDRKVGGVAGGLAEYFGIDPVITRLGFVLAVFAGGLGVAAYIIAWIVLPDSDGTNPPRQPGSRSFDTTTVVALALLAVAATVALANSFDGGFILPIVLVGAGVYLLTQREPELVSAGTGASPSQPATSSTYSGAGGDSPWTPTSAGADQLPDGGPPWASDTTGIMAPPPPAPPQKPALVTRLTLSVLALFFAGAIVGDQAGWFDTSVSTVLALGLAIVGLGLVVGAFVGRSRGLVWFGLLVALAFGVSNVIEPVVNDGIGERNHQPTELSAVQPEYRLGIGDLEVDLTEIEIPDGEDLTVKVVLGIGEATVRVPALTNLVVEGEVGVGELNILEKFEDGIDNEMRVERNYGAQSELTVVLEVGLGEGTVTRNG